MNRRTLLQCIGLSTTLPLLACGQRTTQVSAVVPPPPAQPAAPAPQQVAAAPAGPVVTGPAQVGRASWMSRSLNGRRTANGERHNVNAITAAHRTLPFDSYARVTSADTGKSVIVRINDRGPFVRGRIIDLSEAAAKQLGIYSEGVGTVTVQPVSMPG